MFTLLLIKPLNLFSRNGIFLILYLGSLGNQAVYMPEHCPTIVRPYYYYLAAGLSLIRL